MLELPHVTLLAADSAHPRLALRALLRSSSEIRFARVVLLTDATDLKHPPHVDVTRIAPLRSRDEYSQLMLKGLGEHFATPHVLVVQWDGYVVNPAAWDEAFVACDYIGAKWFWYPDGHRVGNGGFSLRSRRLVDALQDDEIALVDAEDLTIGRTARPLLEQRHGIRFATDELADRFAFEAAYPIGRPFGFHGLFNFARVVPPGEIVALAPSFDDAIARSAQLLQLLRNCIALGQWDAAAALAARRLAALPDDAATATLLAQAQANAARGPVAGRNDPCPCGSGKRYKHCHGTVTSGTSTAGVAATATAGTPAATTGGGQGPRDLDAALQRGIAAHQRGDTTEAESAYRGALAQAPDHPLALHYMGVLEYQRGRLAVALPLLERSIALHPNEPEFHMNHGVALLAAGRSEEAVAAHRRALALRPSHAATWNNLGLAHAATNALDAADEAYRRALELAPDFDVARWNRSLVLLAQGRYTEGWQAYEGRRAIPAFQSTEPAPTVPRFDGTLAPGARLLVTAEQGLGDTLQFIRLARTLAEAGVNVIARVPAKLARLVATVPGVAEVSTAGAPWPACEATIPLLSLPGILDITAERPPVQVPYLAVDAARRADAARTVRQAAAGRRTVGVAWAGAPTNTNDAQRSAPVSALVPLLARTDCTWFSLQHDDERDAAALPSPAHLTRLAQRIDFDDMAALIDVLDLVVTVDTSIAHVAGALGKATWILLPFAADWRWGVTGEATPWYPSMRLFRQPAPGDWAAVIAQVAESLDGLPAA